MKALACLALALALPLSLGACASTPTLKLAPLGGGSIVDRMMVLQESLYAIAGRAKTPAEAAVALERYCAENADALTAMRAESQAIPEDEQTAMGLDLAARTVKLADRVQAAIGEDHMRFLLAPEVSKAMVGCGGGLPGGSAEAPIEGPDGEGEDGASAPE